MNQNGSNPPSDSATTAGRGWIYITLSKIYFIVAGYAVALALPRLLATPEAFGLYSATMGMLSILNNVLNIATIQTVSKKISENLEKASQVLNQGLRIQLIIGSLLSSSLFFGAPFLAEDVLLDTQMTPLIRVVSIVLFCNALYATLVGSLNGRHLFHRQAALDLTYSTLRTMGILGAAALGFGVFGTLSGLSSAVAVLLAIAFAVVGFGKSAKGLLLRSWLLFMAPLWIYHLCLNMILMIDLMVMKRTVAVLALAAQPHQIQEAADIASKFAGFYRAAQTFAFIPYQLLIPVTFIVFPMISKTVSQQNSEATRRTIKEAMRFSILACLAIATPISGAASGVMRLAYPEAYLVGSGALTILSLGMVCFSLFVIAATILSSAGHPSTSAAIGAISLCLVIGGNFTLLHLVGIGEYTLHASAIGTSIGTGFAVFAAGSIIYRKFGVFVEIKTLIRGLLAGACAFAVARMIPSDTRLFSLVALFVGGIAYLITLFLLREIHSADIDMVRGILRRRK